MTVATRAALDVLLRTADPLDLIGVWGQPRGNRMVRSGKHRMRDQIKFQLAVAYATWRWQDRCDESSASQAKKVRMRIVRRA